MYIYNPNENITDNQLILNPDLPFHTSFQDENLNDFFRILTIPKNVKHLASIYIEYEFLPFLYEKYPDVYYKTSKNVQETVSEYFDFENAHIYHNHNNTFYIILFNVTMEQIVDTFTQLYQNLKKRKTLYHKHTSQFCIYCGVYLSSNLRIDPVAFYKSARVQFLNTQMHPHSFISILDTTSR